MKNPNPNLFKVSIGDEMYSIVHAVDKKDAEIIAGVLFGNAVQSVEEATAGEVNRYQSEGYRINYVS